MNISMQGKFTVKKQKVKMLNGVPELDKRGNQIPAGEAWIETEFDNLITDGGLNKLGTYLPIRVMWLSTDTAEPKTSDSSVVGLLSGNYVGSGTLINSSVDTAHFFITHAINVNFAAGQGTGNISKICTGWGTPTDVQGLWSTALVKDSLGNNTVITKLPDEILEVTYALKKIINVSDYVGTVTISGETYNVTVRPSSFKATWMKDYQATPNLGITKCTAYTNNISDYKGYPSGASSDGTLSAKAYVNQSMQKEFVGSFTISTGNFTAGIKSVVFLLSESGDFNQWQVGFSKASDGSGIPKTKDFTLTLPPFIISWGRYVAT